jgi:hypothetical protein
LNKRLRVVAIVVAIVLPVAGTAIYLTYWATQSVPEFYQRAVAQDAVVQKKASAECLQQATVLASDINKRGCWEALFTAEQINGWLAVDLVRNFPDLLPAEVRSPRVAISGRQATVACRYDRGGIATVYSLAFDVYLSAPNVIAVRLHSARAGSLPMPLARVLDGISQGARELEIPIEWRQTGGDPVALIKVPPARDARDNVLQLEAIELRDGEVFVAGHTDRRGAEPTAPADRTAPPKPPAGVDGPLAASDEPAPAQSRVAGAAKKEKRHK